MKTKKVALALWLGALLAGCDRTPMATDDTASYVLPPELQDCKIFRLVPEESEKRSLYVVRCPNSSTTTGWVTQRQYGKQSTSEDFSVTLISK